MSPRRYFLQRTTINVLGTVEPKMKAGAHSTWPGRITLFGGSAFNFLPTTPHSFVYDDDGNMTYVHAGRRIRKINYQWSTQISNWTVVSNPHPA